MDVDLIARRGGLNPPSVGRISPVLRASHLDLDEVINPGLPGAAEDLPDVPLDDDGRTFFRLGCSLLGERGGMEPSGHGGRDRGSRQQFSREYHDDLPLDVIILVLAEHDTVLAKP